MKLRIRLLMIGWSLVLSGAPAWASRSASIPNSRYDDARSAAMGDSTNALADSPIEALFANPAGIAKIRKPSVELLNVRFSGTQDYFANFGTSSAKVNSLSSYSSTLTKKAGSDQGIGYHLAPAIGFRGFAIGAVYSKDVSAYAQDGNIHYHARYQLIPAAGFGLRLASGVIRLGYSIQYVMKAQGDLSQSASTTPLGYNEGLKQGSALSHTAGFALTLPFQYLPSFTLVARNIMGTKYSTQSSYKMASNPSTSAPATEKMSIDLGVLFQPKVGGGGVFNMTGEYKDLLGSSHASVLAKIATGIEFNFRETFYLRGGIGYGYPTAGLGLRTKKSEFSMAWTSDELGSSYRSEREIRTTFQYQTRVF
jgi:hypothetical protein